MKIIVKAQTVNVRSGKSRAGRDYSIRSQPVIAELGEERRSIELTLEDNQTPYAPGIYTVDLEQSLQIGRFGQLEQKRQFVFTSHIPLPQHTSKAA